MQPSSIADTVLGMTTDQFNQAIRLAKRIEAGLIAQEILDESRPSCATIEELETLTQEGKQAKDDLIVSHLGLVRVIAAEAARRTRLPMADLFQEGCLALQQAVMSYDYHKGPFGPYAAMWIRAAVRRVPRRSWVTMDHVEVVDPGVERGYEQTINREGLAQVLGTIEADQSVVVRLRTGWEGSVRTRRSIASELGISVSRVRYLERVGLEAMRRQWESSQAA